MVHRMRFSWAIADQVLVSGSNFAIGVTLARALGIATFGRYTESSLLLLYINTLPMALVISPMMSLVPKLDEGEGRTLLSGIMAAQVVLAVLSGLLLWGISALMIVWPHSGRTWDAVLPLVLSAVLFQLQDWLRRYFFLVGQERLALMGDLLQYGGQLLMIVLLSRLGTIGVPEAFWVLALSSAIACTFGVAVGGIRPALQRAGRDFRRCWSLGRDLLLAGQFQWAGSQGVLLMSSHALGVQALGGIRAAINIVGPLNILFQSMENTIPAQAARRYASDRLPGLTAYLGRVGTLGGAGLALLCLAIGLASSRLLTLAYGPEYAPFAALVTWQLVYMLLGFFTRQLTYFHRTIGSSSAISTATLRSALLSLAVTPVALLYFHESGVMLGMVAGQVAILVHLLLQARKAFTIPCPDPMLTAP